MIRKLPSLLVIIILLFPGSMSVRGQAPVIITIGTTDFPASLDPAIAVDLPSWEVLNHLSTGLTRQQPGSLNYELALAATHIMSADGLTHRFEVREDAFFDDGTPITAEVFATSINRVINLGRDGAEFVGRFVRSVNAEPGNQLVFTLYTPLPDFEALVGLPPFFPQHPASYPTDAVLDMTDSDLTLITNGLYRLEGYTPGQDLRLAANPGYQDILPANDAIILRSYALPIDLRQALLAREIDIAWRALARPDLDAAAAIPELLTQTQPNLQMFYLLLNHNTISINNQNSFDDPALREAFTRLLDRNTSAELGWDGALLPANTVVPEQFELAEIAFPDYDYTNADVILEEAGYRPRRRTVSTAINISTDTYSDLLASATNELQRGIEQSEIVDISFISDAQTSTFISAVNRGEYLSAIIGWRPHFASPAAYFYGLVHSSSPIPNGAGFDSPELDALLQEAGLTSDADARAEIYNDLARQLLDDSALIPLWQGQDVITSWQDIQGIQLEVNSWLRYDRLTH